MLLIALGVIGIGVGLQGLVRPCSSLTTEVNGELVQLNEYRWARCRAVLDEWSGSQYATDIVPLVDASRRALNSIRIQVFFGFIIGTVSLIGGIYRLARTAGGGSIAGQKILLLAAVLIGTVVFQWFAFDALMSALETLEWRKGFSLASGMIAADPTHEVSYAAIRRQSIIMIAGGALCLAAVVRIAIRRSKDDHV